MENLDKLSYNGKSPAASLTLALADFGELLQIGGEEFCPADVIADVDLLILRVGAVVGRAHRQQHHVLPRRLLERERDRDGAALPGQIWFDAVHQLLATLGRGSASGKRGGTEK